MPNIHPIFVHFPMALLTLYALFECARLVKYFDTDRWLTVRTVLITIGAAAAIVTDQTGDFATSSISRDDALLRKILDTHETFAAITITLACIAALPYLLVWLKREIPAIMERFSPLPEIAERLIIKPIAIPFSLLVLAAITITGALGGMMVYGITVDPVVTLVYTILIK